VVLLLMATAATGLFAGAAIYVSVVERLTRRIEYTRRLP
jgi:hypothetical protein